MFKAPLKGALTSGCPWPPAPVVTLQKLPSGGVFTPRLCGDLQDHLQERASPKGNAACPGLFSGTGLRVTCAEKLVTRPVTYF